MKETRRRLSVTEAFCFSSQFPSHAGVGLPLQQSMINYHSSPYGGYDTCAQYHQQEQQEQAIREQHQQQQYILQHQQQQQRAYQSHGLGSSVGAGALSSSAGCGEMLPLPIGYPSYGHAISSDRYASPSRNRTSHPAASLTGDYYPAMQQQSPPYYDGPQQQIYATDGSYHCGNAYLGPLGPQHYLPASSINGSQTYPHARGDGLLPPLQIGNLAPMPHSGYQHQSVDNASWQPSILPPALHLGRHPAHSSAAVQPRYEDYREDAESLWSGYGDDNAAAEAEQYQQQQHEAAARLAIVQQQQSFCGVQQPVNEEWQLIAPDATAIPPPPPIEKSAFPLAALATDLVWDAFLNASNRNSPMSTSSNSSSGQFASAGGSPDIALNRHGRNALSSSPRAPGLHQRTPSKTVSPLSGKHDRSRSISAGLDSDTGGAAQQARSFGAIGRERKPRPSVETSPGSDMSSPASSAPGTPAMDSWTVTGHAESHHQQRSSNPLAARFGSSGYWSDDDQVMSDAHAGKQASLPPISTLLRPAFQQHSQRFGSVTPPMALFEQVQGLLRATLVSQQVLLLALYYVARIPQTSPLYPPATSQSALQSTSAPFKLLLAALVVANKHLDDNSFRNSTWAQVANVALPEVNALEFSLLAGLNFDINVEAPDWLAYLVDTRSHRATAFVQGQVSTESLVGPLIESARAQEQNVFEAKESMCHAAFALPDAVLRTPPSASAATRSQRVRAASRSHAVQHPAIASPVTGAGLDYGGDLLTPRSETSSMSGGFDLDAAGPIEQRPRYKTTQSLTHPYKQTSARHQYLQPSQPQLHRWPFSHQGFRTEQTDEAKFSTGRCIEQSYGRFGMDGYRYPGGMVAA